MEPRNPRSRPLINKKRKKRKPSESQNDWVVIGEKKNHQNVSRRNKERVIPRYVCDWKIEDYLNNYFDENYRDVGNPCFVTTTEHFVFVGTLLGYVLKFRYYNLNGDQRKFSKKVEKFYWKESDKELGRVINISVLISINHKASSSFPILVSYECRDCIIWRNNFFEKPNLRFSFDQYKPRTTIGEFLLDNCVVFNTEGEKIQFWDFRTKKVRVWKNFLDITNPDAVLGCQLEIINFSENLAFLGLVHDNKIQIHSYSSGDEKDNPHGTTQLLFQKATDERFNENRIIKICCGKLHTNPFIGILENHNFYFYEIFHADPKEELVFNEKRACLLKRIIFNESFSHCLFQNYEFLIWNSEVLYVYHPFQDYLNISDFPRNYPGNLLRLTDNSLLFFGGERNGEFLNFQLFERNFKYLKKDDESENKLRLRDQQLPFIQRDGVCIISEDDTLRDTQITGRNFGNKFHLSEKIRQPVLLATNDAQDVIYVCSIGNIEIYSSNEDFTYLKYPKYCSILACNLRDNGSWRTVLDLENSQTLRTNPIESNFPVFFSGMYYQKKDHSLYLVSTRYIYIIDIINRNIKGVVSSKKIGGFFKKKKLEFPNIYIECSSSVISSNSTINQIFVLGEERSLLKTPPSNPMIVADSLCLYSIDLEKRNITLLENMIRNDKISRSTNKKLFSFYYQQKQSSSIIIKLYIVCDIYPYIFEKKGNKWVVVDIPFLEPPISKKMRKKEEEIDEEFISEEQEGEEEEQQNNNKKKKRGLRITKFFNSTVCQTPASILFLCEANTPKYRKWVNPYIFEYSIIHQKWKRPLSIESVTLKQVLESARCSTYVYKGEKKKRIMLYNETVFHSKKSFERDIISISFM